MDIQATIKNQAEIAIALQGKILEDLRDNGLTDKQALDKIKIINLTFDNFLKIRETLNSYLGDIESETYLSEVSEEDILESIY
jgi:hypothetical protein